MSNKNLIISSWVDEYSEVLGKETFSILKSLGDPKDATQLFVGKFLQHFIDLAVYDSLTQLPNIPETDEEAYTMTRDNLSSLKVEMQTEIAMAFEKALSRYAGKKTEYYCIIRPVPEPVSKLFS